MDRRGIQIRSGAWKSFTWKSWPVGTEACLHLRHSEHLRGVGPPPWPPPVICCLQSPPRLWGHMGSLQPPSFLQFLGLRTRGQPGGTDPLLALSQEAPGLIFALDSRSTSPMLSLRSPTSLMFSWCLPLTPRSPTPC